MSNLQTLKQKVEEMKAEIARIEAEEREPEIPVGTLCWFWDDGSEHWRPGILDRKLTDVEGPYIYRTSGCGWQNARIANDIPGTMVWQKHDGGPCPVGADVEVIVSGVLGGLITNVDSVIIWCNVDAYAIINKAEWM